MRTKMHLPHVTRRCSQHQDSLRHFLHRDDDNQPPLSMLAFCINKTRPQPTHKDRLAWRKW